MITLIWYIVAILTTLFASAIIITPIILLIWWLKTIFIKRRKPKDMDNKIEEYNKLKKEVEDERQKRRNEITGDGFKYSRSRYFIGAGKPESEIRNIKNIINRKFDEGRRIPISNVNDDKSDESESGEDSEAVELHKPTDL